MCHPSGSKTPHINLCALKNWYLRNNNEAVSLSVAPTTWTSAPLRLLIKWIRRVWKSNEKCGAMTDEERDAFVLFALFVSFAESLLYEPVSVELIVQEPSGRPERFVEGSIDPGLVLPLHCFHSDPLAVCLSFLPCAFFLICLLPSSQTRYTAGGLNAMASSIKKTC